MQHFPLIGLGVRVDDLVDTVPPKCVKIMNYLQTNTFPTDFSTKPKKPIHMQSYSNLHYLLMSCIRRARTGY